MRDSKIRELTHNLLRDKKAANDVSVEMKIFPAYLLSELFLLFHLCPNYHKVMHAKSDEAKRKEREANKKCADVTRIISDNNKTLDEAIANNDKKLERTILAERECLHRRIACVNDANKLYFDGMAQRIRELETICEQQRIELKSNKIDQRRDMFELKNDFVSQKRSFLQTFSEEIASARSDGNVPGKQLSQAKCINVDHMKAWFTSAYSKEEATPVEKEVLGWWNLVVDIIQECFESRIAPEAFWFGTLVIIPKDD